MRLSAIKALEDKITSFRLFVDNRAENIAQFDIDSEEAKDLFAIVEEANVNISMLLTVLTIEKAKAGIIGKNWYKQDD